MAERANNFYAGGDGASANLIWDDVTMLASGVHVTVPKNGRRRVVSAVINKQPVSLTYDPGTDTIFSFPVPLAVSFVQTRRGTEGMVISGFGSFGVATGD